MTDPTVWMNRVLAIAMGAMMMSVVVVRAHVVNSDFDGDGLSDPSYYFFQSGSGYFFRAWHHMLSMQGYVDTAGPSAYSGSGGSVAALAGDYDGDGKSDYGTYSGGQWSIDSSLSGATTTFTFGNGSWRPVSADFDGDGRADPTVYSGGYWYALFSSWQYRTVAFVFGNAQFVPVAGDFDGDGLSDPAVVSTTTGYWYYMLSSYSYQMALFTGLPAGYAPVAGDYDGDRKSDPGIYANGSWYMVLSASGFAPWSFSYGGADQSSYKYGTYYNMLQ